MDTEKWIHEAVCDTTKNTLCGISTCIAGLKSTCPVNTVTVKELTNPGVSISDNVS